jgi:hypothetical protein
VTAATCEIELDARPLSRDWRPAFAAAVVALLLYGVTLGGTYVYDDLVIVGSDPRLKDPSRWGEYWTKDYFNGGIDNLYRPLVSMSYAIQWWLHGDRPWAFHAVNWLLHAAASAAVAELARRLAGTRVALITGLLFAAHPIHVEAVANIVGRAELACTLAMTSALILLLRRPMTIARALAIWGCCVAAVLSKEQGLLMPLLMLILELLRRRSWLPASATPSSGERGMTLLVVLICWSFAGYIVFRETMLKFWWDPVFLDWTMNPIVLARGADRWLMPIALLGRYLALLVAPVKLSIDYGGSIIGWEVSITDPYLYLGLATIVGGVMALAIALRQRAGVAAFCLIGLGLSYGLVSNVAMIIGTNFGERLMYLPSAFFLMLMAMTLARLRFRVLAAMMSLLLALGSARTVTYAARWNDRMSFYASSLRAQPRSVRLNMLLSEEYQRRGDLAAAEQMLARGRAVEPTYARVWLNSALLAVIQGKYDAAASYAREAHRLDPRVRNSELERLLNDWYSTSRPTTQVSDR